jgi:hypothetical protein
MFTVTNKFHHIKPKRTSDLRNRCKSSWLPLLLTSSPFGVAYQVVNHPFFLSEASSITLLVVAGG